MSFTVPFVRWEGGIISVTLPVVSQEPTKSQAQSRSSMNGFEWMNKSSLCFLSPNKHLLSVYLTPVTAFGSSKILFQTLLEHFQKHRPHHFWKSSFSETSDISSFSKQDVCVFFMELISMLLPSTYGHLLLCTKNQRIKPLIFTKTLGICFLTWATIYLVFSLHGFWIFNSMSRAYKR